MTEEELLAKGSEIAKEIKSYFDELHCEWYPAAPEGTMQINFYLDLKGAASKRLGYDHQIVLRLAIEQIKVIGRRTWVMRQATIIHEAFLKTGADLIMVD